MSVDVTYEYVKVIRPPATLFILKDRRELWLPIKSIEHIDEEHKTVTIPDWLAAKKGLD